MTHFIREKLLPWLGFVALWLLVFVAILAAGFQIIMAQGEGRFARWERLPAPPVTPFELVPNFSSPMVRDSNGVLYSFPVFASADERGWERYEYELQPWEGAYENHCRVEDIPASWVSALPKNLVLCHHLYYGADTSTSYLAMDDAGQLWTLLNLNSWSGGLVMLVVLLIGAFIVSPLITVWLMRRLAGWYTARRGRENIESKTPRSQAS